MNRNETEAEKNGKENLPLVVEEFDFPPMIQDFSKFDLSGDEVLSLLSMFDLYGVWRINLEQARVYWSEDMFKLHGLPYTKEGLDLQNVLEAYHPEDVKIIAQLFDEAITSKSGFRYVLRMRQADGSYKLVKCKGRHRINKKGKPELVGLCSEFQLPIRSIAIPKK